MYFDDAEAERIKSYFAENSSLKMTDNNLQQAMLPQGCTVFRNDRGTAPGCAFESGGTTVIMLPGPPSECNAMFAACAMPYLRKMSDGEIVSHSIRVFGLGESAVEAKLRDLMNSLANPTLAPYAKEGEVMLRVTAKVASRAEAEEMMKPVIAAVSDTLGDLIYGIDVDSLEARVSDLLRESGKTIAAAESCTGGLLAKRLTDLPGASAVFRGGVTVYTNESKKILLGIPGGVLSEYGAVSRETAELMARNIRAKLNADIGVGITGDAGPDSPPGEETGVVFVSVSDGSGTYTVKKQRGLGRSRVRTAAANLALDMVRRLLTGLPVDGG